MPDHSRLHKLAVEGKEVFKDLWAVILLVILMLGGFAWAIDAVMDLMPVVLLVMCAFFGLCWGLYELLGWVLLSKYGVSTTGKCTRMTVEPYGSDGYTRTLYYEFQTKDAEGKIRTYAGDSWVPLRLYKRVGTGSDLRIRYWVKNPKINRIDEDDYRNWGFRSESEGGGDFYPDTQKSAYD